MVRWTLYRIAFLMPDEESAKQWAIREGLVKTQRWCARHDKQAKLVPGPLFGLFRCRGAKKGKPFDHQSAVAANTWFENLHCHVRQRIILTYAFANSFSFKQALNEASILDTTLSRETVSDVYMYCREVCMASLDRTYSEDGKIGGPGTIVEIDECKIGKRKYNVGRMVDGHWILGMIERGGSGYRLEICPENSRSEDSLLPLIQKHVEQGTEIHTDLWRGYINLESYGYIHKTVNHSQNFVDPETGAYTQNIESSWRFLRRRLARGGINTNLDLHMCEFLWRKRNVALRNDLFQSLLDDIKILYPGYPEVEED